MSEQSQQWPPALEDISRAFAVEEAARHAEWEIQEAGRKAAAEVPRRLFRTVATQHRLESAAYRTAVEKASHDKSSPV